MNSEKGVPLRGRPRDDIEAFVRVRLGCACPDEVFRNMFAGTSLLSGAGGLGVREINIGNRLLIVLVNADAEGFDERAFARIVQHGRNRRDAEGFNRLRVVLVAANPVRLSETLGVWRTELDNVDDKVHIHIVSCDDVPQW